MLGTPNKLTLVAHEPQGPVLITAEQEEAHILDLPEARVIPSKTGPCMLLFGWS